MSRQQTVGSLNEVIGTNQSDREKGGNLDIVYGLADDDTIISKSGDSANDIDDLSTTVLVGGTGNDSYKLGKQAITVILDNGASKKDVAIAKGIGLNSNSSYVAEVENKHLLAGDAKSGQIILLLNWTQKKHRIEKFKLSDSKLNYRTLKSDLETYDNYLGDFTLEEIEKASGIDLSDLGISASTLDDSIETISKRADQLEKRSNRTLDTDPLIGSEQVVGSAVDFGDGSESVSIERSEALYSSDRTFGELTISNDASGLLDLLPPALHDPLLDTAILDTGF